MSCDGLMGNPGIGGAGGRGGGGGAGGGAFPGPQSLKMSSMSLHLALACAGQYWKG